MDIERALEVVEMRWDNWLQFACEASRLSEGLSLHHRIVILEWDYLSMMLQI